MNNITISLPKLVSCNSISSCSKVKHKHVTSNEGYIVEKLDKYNMKSWFLTDKCQGACLNIVDEGCNILC